MCSLLYLYSFHHSFTQSEMHPFMHTIQFNSNQSLFKVETFWNVTNNISFKLLHPLDFENTTQ